jgi:hypothetical protein
LSAPATPADGSQAQPPLNGIVPPVENLPASPKLADEFHSQPSLNGIDSLADNLPASAKLADESQAQPPLNGIVPPVNNLPDSLKLPNESQAQPSLDGIDSPVDNLPSPEIFVDVSQVQASLDGIGSPVDNLPDSPKPAGESQAQPSLDGIDPVADNLPASAKLADESQAQPSLDSQSQGGMSEIDGLEASAPATPVAGAPGGFLALPAPPGIHAEGAQAGQAFELQTLVSSPGGELSAFVDPAGPQAAPATPMPDGKVSEPLDEAPAEPSIDPASGSAALSSLAWGNAAISEQAEPASSSALGNPPAEPPMVSASEQAEPQALVAADQPPEPVAPAPMDVEPARPAQPAGVRRGRGPTVNTSPDILHQLSPPGCTIRLNCALSRID